MMERELGEARAALAEATARAARAGEAKQKYKEQASAVVGGCLVVVVVGLVCGGGRAMTSH